ncbi:MAG: hypothetical protein ACR2JO_07990 [Mycobacteriales bacterium]
MSTFRKKPVEIEAMPIAAETKEEDFLDPNSRSIAEASGWMMSNGFRAFKVHGKRPFGIAIETLEGVMVASPGDWIIRGVQGEFYPCAPSIFEATYEPAEPTATRRDERDERG